MLARNECLVAVQAELDALDVPYMVNPNARHIKVTFKINDKPHTATLPKTPSDWRSVKNARAQIRRLIKAAGATPSGDTHFVASRVRKALEAQQATEAPEPVQEIAVPPVPAAFDPQPLYDRIAKLESDLHALADLMADIKPQIVNNHLVTQVVKPKFVNRIRERRRA